MKDSWIPGTSSSEINFFDTVDFNQDVIPAHPQHPLLAQIYWRIDVNELLHERVVFQFKDWLASIAGIEKFLLKYLTMVFGGFINYNAAIEIIN